ncbi:MAG: sigma-70 family RNA polymerase sigma factor [Byssovorax sp.]
MTVPTRPSAPGAADPLDAYALYTAAFAYVSNALARMGCPEPDRDDIAQRVVVKAYRRWPQYDPARGSPGRWLWGIARNELRGSRRRRPPRPLLGAPAPASDVGGDNPSPEAIALMKDLASFIWKGVPEAEQRVLWDRVIGGASFEEIADLQGISKSQAQRLYTKGMSRLRAALKRADERKLLGVAVPFGLDDLFDMRHGPPVAPEALERGFQAMLIEMGRDEGDPDQRDPPPEGETAVPASGSPSSRPAGLGSVLGPIAGILAGAFIAGLLLPRCGRDHGREERPDAALAPTPAAPVRPAVSSDPAPSPVGCLASVASNAGVGLAPNPGGAGGQTRPAAHAPGDVRLASRREGLWAQAYARLRPAVHGDMSKNEARCAGKPPVLPELGEP